MAEEEINKKCPGVLGAYIPSLRGLLTVLFLFLALLPCPRAWGKGTAAVVYTGSYEEFGRAASSLPKNAGRIKGGEDFPSERLIIKTRGGSFDFTPYGPDTVVVGPENHYFLSFSDRGAAKAAYEELVGNSGFVYVEADAPAYIAQTPAASLSSVKYYSWGVEEIGAGHFAQSLALKNPGSITVAILDSGIDSAGADHPLLRGKKLTGFNYVDNNTDTVDQNGHGTHVTGIIADCMQGLDVFFLPVKVMNSGGFGFEMDVASGIRYAASHGAKVINMSIECEGTCSYVREAILYAIRKGACVVVAAGNNGWDVANEGISNLAAAIVVGAVDSGREHASFSNFGNTLDIVAPGVNIKSAFKSPERWKTLSGTSMAAPHISAVVAMYRLAYPGKKPAEIEYLLKQNVTDLGEPGWDPYYGAGLPNLLPLCNLSDDSFSQVVLSAGSLQMKVGTSYKLSAQVYPVGTTPSLTWKSSNPSVVRVTDGRVRAMDTGTAIIEVSIPTGRSDTCKVTVQSNSVSPTSVKLEQESIRLAVGESMNLAATVFPDAATDKSLTWHSSNTSIASVSGGRVEAKGSGVAIISVSTVNGKRDSCSVSVYNATDHMGNVKSISGGKQILAIDQRGILWGWGENSEGQLGDGSREDQLQPIPVLYSIKAVDTYSSATVAISEEGVLYGTGHLTCLGKNLSQFEPLMRDVKDAALGDGFVAILKNNGNLYLYGEQKKGHPGYGTKMTPDTPILVSKSVTSLSACYGHVAFVKTGGKAWVFGNGSEGQLGNGAKTSLALPGTRVLTKVTQVATGYGHTLFLRSNGTLWACGTNRNGQLGDGTKISRLKPVKVAKSVAQVCAGYLHTVIRKKNGSVWTVGYGTYGQLGSGVYASSTTFKEVGQGASCIGAGQYSSFYASGSQTFACGSGSSGEMGNRTTKNQNRFKEIKK